MLDISLGLMFAIYVVCLLFQLVFQRVQLSCYAGVHTRVFDVQDEAADETWVNLGVDFGVSVKGLFDEGLNLVIA